MLREAAQQGAMADLDELRKSAQAHGLQLVQGQDGAIKLLPAEETPDRQPAERKGEVADHELVSAMAKFQLRIVVLKAELDARIQDLNRSIADEMASAMLEKLVADFSGFSGLARWLTEVRVDILENPMRFQLPPEEDGNQLGQAQAIDGAHWKVEGFFRICQAKPGGLTGTQGVIVPDSNRVNLVLSDEVASAVAAGRFHLWSVANVEEAVELLLGIPAGVVDAEGKFPPHSAFGQVSRRLATFDRALADRQVGRPY